MKTVLFVIVLVILTATLPAFSVEVPNDLKKQSVILHENIAGTKKDYALNLTVHELGQIVGNYTGFRNKNKSMCSVGKIYFDGDATHVTITCKKK